MAKLEYYCGRAVTRVHADGREDAHDWMIELEGGVMIKNYDEAHTTIPVLDGMSFLAPVYEAGGVRLKFGASDQEGVNVMEEILLAPDQYSIADNNEYTHGEEVFPGREAPREITLPDHPDERIADGPSQEWLDNLAKMQAETAVEASESDSKAV